MDTLFYAVAATSGSSTNSNEEHSLSVTVETEGRQSEFVLQPDPRSAFSARSVGSSRLPLAQVRHDGEDDPVLTQRVSNPGSHPHQAWRSTPVNPISGDGFDVGEGVQWAASER